MENDEWDFEKITENLIEIGIYLGAFVFGLWLIWFQIVNWDKWYGGWKILFIVGFISMSFGACMLIITLIPKSIKKKWEEKQIIKKCLSCGKEIDIEWKVCPFCESLLNGEEKIFVKTEEKEKYKKCPSCGNDIEPDWTACPFCEYEFEKSKEEKKCPSCGENIEPDWTACPYCQFELQPKGGN